MIFREHWSILLWLGAGVGLVLLYFWAAGPSNGQNPNVPVMTPLSREQINMSFAPVVKLVAPAVVNVYTRKVVQQPQSPFFDDPFFRHFFGLEGQGNMPRERIQNSLGSGVIVGADGIIVTNNHVIAGGEEFIVALSDRREYEAEVVLADERSDLAVLRIDTKGQKLPFIQFRDSDTLQVGDLVLAIGNPFGVGQTVTSGIVSALARTQVGISDYQFFIQTDAAVNPGNSGGALVTMDGRLAGINTAIFTRTGGSIGIGFAIPANMVRLVVDTAIAGGKLARPWFGASAQTVTQDIANSLGLDRPRGVVLEEVSADGPAGQAGLQPGDVILKVDGFEINDPQSLRYRIATTGVGKSVNVEYLRKGRDRTATVKLTRPPENPPRNVTELNGLNPLAGATVGNLSPAFAEELRLEATKGVVVLATQRGSAAARIRLRPGDIILEINGHKVTNVEALPGWLEEGNGQWQLIINRGGQTFTLNLGG